MRHCVRILSLHRAVALSLCLLVAPAGISAKKVLKYDEEKGIIFVDENETASKPEKKTPRPQLAAPAKKSAPAPRVAPGAPKRTGLQRARGPQDLHVGREKDPAETYFSSGIAYYKAGNYADALKNFLHADSLDSKPVFALWAGKAYGKMNKESQMLLQLRKVVRAYPESKVADDALFELAVHFQLNNDYEQAMAAYKKLIEQYPFGSSYSTGLDFIGEAKRQRRFIRSEIISTLNYLGYDGEDLRDLYRRFQKSNGLPVTGRGDAETIVAIKSLNERKKKNEIEEAGRHVRMQQLIRWGYVSAAVAVINLFAVMLAFRRIGEKKRQLAEMHNLLTTLDTATL